MKDEKKAKDKKPSTSSSSSSSDEEEEEIVKRQTSIVNRRDRIFESRSSLVAPEVKKDKKEDSDDW
jgi:hypothetical protein